MHQKIKMSGIVLDSENKCDVAVVAKLKKMCSYVVEEKLEENATNQTNDPATVVEALKVKKRSN